MRKKEKKINIQMEKKIEKLKEAILDETAKELGKINNISSINKIFEEVEKKLKMSKEEADGIKIDAARYAVNNKNYETAIYLLSSLQEKYEGIKECLDYLYSLSLKKTIRKKLGAEI